MARKKKQVQLTMWGEAVKEPKSTAPRTTTYDYKGHPLRMVLINGQPWCALSDAASVLGYRDAANAGRIVRDRNKGTHLMSTPGGMQNTLVINEPGLYQLTLRSDKEEALAFQDWVTDEVIPSIMKTGSYTVEQSPMKAMQKKLKCNEATALARIDNKAANKAAHKALSKGGARVPSHFAGFHCAGYLGTFGKQHAEIKTEMKLSKNESVLDHMGVVPLLIMSLARANVAKLSETQNLTHDQQTEMLETISHDLTTNCLNKQLGGHFWGYQQDPARGLVLDAYKPQLTHQP